MKSTYLFFFCLLVLFTYSWTKEYNGAEYLARHRLVKRQVDNSPQGGSDGADTTHSQRRARQNGGSRSATQYQGRSRSTTARRQYVGADGQPYYEYQPHVSTSRGSGSAQTSSSSSSSSAATSSRRRTVTSHGDPRRRDPTTSIVDGSVRSRGRTYNYPFGHERTAYQYSSGSQDATAGAGSLSGGTRTHQAGISGGREQLSGSSVNGLSGSSSSSSRSSSSSGSSSRQVSGGGLRTSQGSTATDTDSRWRVVPDGDNRRRIIANRRTRVDLSQGQGQQQGHSSQQQTPSRRPASSSGSSDTSRLLTNRRRVSSVSTQNSRSGVNQAGNTQQQGTQTRHRASGGVVHTSRGSSSYPDPRRTGHGQSNSGTVISNRRQTVDQRRRNPSTSSQNQGGRTQTVYSRPSYTHPGFRATLQQSGSSTTRVFNPQTGRWEVARGGYQAAGGRLQPPRRGQTYPGGSLSSYNPVVTGVDGGTGGCPETGIELRISGMSCQQAVQQNGAYLCYTHEYTSRQCCEVCTPLRQPDKIGCEYGDHAPQCGSISPADCYDLRNRQTCCQTCERFRIAGAPPGCEYGDMSDQCPSIRQNAGLCYIPDNQRLCCNTCNMIRNQAEPTCPWGDYNSELCQLFDQGSTDVRINCYSPHRRRLCCQSCERLKQWVPDDVPNNCEYGDRPVIFNTDQFGRLNCSTVLQYFSANECHTNPAVSVNCCHTCHRHLRSRG